MFKKLTFITMVLLLAAASSSFAVSVFNNPMWFDGKNFEVEGFDSYNDNQYVNSTFSIDRDATLTMTGVVTTHSESISPGKVLSYRSYDGGGTIKITFSVPVRTVGFFLVGQGNSSWDRSLYVTTTDNVVHQYGDNLYTYLPSTASGDINGFIGFYDEIGIKEFYWSWQSDASYYDSVYYGNNVTEQDPWAYQTYATKADLPGLPTYNGAEPWEYQEPEEPNTIPEPATILMFTCACAGLLRKKFRAK